MLGIYWETVGRWVTMRAVRAAAAEQAAAAQEERIQRTIRRSQLPVKQRTGKPVMFRSHLVTRKKKTQEHDEKQEDKEDKASADKHVADRIYAVGTSLQLMQL